MQEKKRLEYTEHARRRMAQRRITELEVEAVLTSYYVNYHDVDGNNVYVGDVSGRRIKVVVAKDSNPQVIITAADKGN